LRNGYDHSSMIDFNHVLLGFLPQWSISQPPVGIGYIGSYLQSKGILVTQRDFSIELYRDIESNQKSLLDPNNFLSWQDDTFFNKEIFPYILPYVEQWSHEWAIHPAGIIGLSMFPPNKIMTLLLAKEIKKRAPEKLIVVGGPRVSETAEANDVISHDAIDFVVTGEGEEVMLELVQAINSDKNYSQVKGLIYKNDNGVCRTEKRPLILKISDLPPPSFTGFPLEEYENLLLPLVGSRGCIFACTFCSETRFWKRFRFRTAENLMQEVVHQIKKYGYNRFDIVDSLINGNIGELEKFCDLIIESGIEVHWTGKASIRKQMTRELLAKMAKAGCYNINYGIESGSPKVVKDMKKGFTHDIAERVIKDTKEVGIESAIFWMVGFPTETKEDFQLSLDFLKKNKNNIFTITLGSGCQITPGTELHDHPQQFNIISLENSGHKWVSKYSTPEIRDKRYLDTRELCKQEGIRFNYKFL